MGDSEQAVLELGLSDQAVQERELSVVGALLLRTAAVVVEGDGR